MLVHPQPNAPTCVTTDASNTAVDGQWKPISFFSRKLNPAKLKYSAFDRELLAAYLATRHFQFFLEGRVFHINTDHKPLTFALQSSTERRLPRQARHLAFIPEFTSDIRHIHGESNAVADALSRSVSAITRTPVELEALASAQLSAREIQQLPSTNTSL